MKDVTSLAQAFFYGGIGLLFGSLCGYHVFTSGWSILSNMIVYIVGAVLICYFKNRSSK